MIPSAPLSLYIHFPWCIKKCPYCDFNSHPLGGALDENRYIKALLADLDLELQTFKVKGSIGSIFLGGGTPSLFSPEAINTLLTAVAQRLELSKTVEITMEANPGTSEYYSFEGYYDAGINRLSVGVQSFNQQHLNTLGRIHSPDDSHQAISKARQGGFDNYNIDLMFGLPHQSKGEAMDDLDAAMALGPTHLSLYQLTIEPNTVFHRYPPQLPEQDDIIDIQHELQNKLVQQGFEQYEVSAYCRPDRQCRHNINYWQFGDYIGIGPGAHGKITVDNIVSRRARKKHPETYLQSAGTCDAIAENKEVNRNEILLEFLMNALRLKDGCELSMAESRTGIAEQTIRKTLSPFVSQGLLVSSNDRIQCSDKGYLFIDEILSQLL